MRVFLAIKTSEGITKEIVRLQGEIKRNDSVSAGFPAIKNIHLTMKFIGEVNERELNLIKERLKGIDFRKLQIRTTNMGFFPSQKNLRNLRVIWLGIEKNSELEELYNMINTATKEYSSDHKSFSAHITIARIRHIEKDKMDELLRTFRGIKIKQIEQEVNSFVLYKSTSTPEGLVYEIVEEYYLT